MSAVAHFFMSVAGSKIHERLAHFFIDIYTVLSGMGLSPVTVVWNYVVELILNLLILVGAVKASDRITKEVLGL